MRRVSYGNIVAAVTAALLTACGSLAKKDFPPWDGEEQLPYYQQLVLKFKPEQGICDDTGIREMAATVRVKVEMVGPRSGNACVVRQYSRNPDYFQAQQRVLAEYPAVQWVEQDEAVKPY